jgi:hypothetical protein
MFANVVDFWKVSALLIALSVATAGCSGSPKPVVGDVKGKVTLDGSPFSPGNVAFKGRSTGVGTTAQLQPDGTYRVVTPEGGLREDTYEVAILPLPVVPADPVAATIEAAKGNAPPPDTSKIPEKYRDFATSTFTVTVKKGENQGDFDMKSM